MGNFRYFLAAVGCTLAVLGIFVEVERVAAQIAGAEPTDILGQYVIGIQGVPVAAVAPQDGQVLVYKSAINRYVPTTITIP